MVAGCCGELKLLLCAVAVDVAVVAAQKKMHDNFLPFFSSWRQSYNIN